MKIIKNLLRSLVFVAVVISAAGCANQKAWVYRGNTFALPASSSGKKIAVVAFTDARENKNSNCAMMYLIPLMPCGWQTLNAPEGSQMHMTSGLWLNYKPTEDYPKALAEDLRKTGIFSDAFFDYQRDRGDYGVTGRILSTKYKGYLISYGLSAYGPLLWFFGFPAASTSNELSVELNLIDSKTEKSLFSKVYTAKPQKKVSWIYMMRDDFNYAEMLAEVNKQFCMDISPIVLGAAKAQ